MCAGPIAGKTDGQPLSEYDAMTHCSTTWLTGYNVWTAHDEAYPFGLGGTVAVVVARHFYNPSGRTGVVDSGMRYGLTATPTLRPKELSLFTMGTTQLAVPAQTYGHTVESQCTMTSTSFWSISRACLRSNRTPHTPCTVFYLVPMLIWC